MKELVTTNHNYFFSIGTDCDNMRHGLDRIDPFTGTNNDIKLWSDLNAVWDGYVYMFFYHEV